MKTLDIEMKTVQDMHTASSDFFSLFFVFICTYNICAYFYSYTFLECLKWGGLWFEVQPVPVELQLNVVSEVLKEEVPESCVVCVLEELSWAGVKPVWPTGYSSSLIRQF